MTRFLCGLFFLGLHTLAYGQAIPKTVTLASTDWCPYVCDKQTNKPGIIHEYLTLILKEQGIQLNIEFNPWHESVKKAELGQVHGLLTATRDEAPELLFTTTPTANYQVCFITKRNQNWLYKNTNSLYGITLGSIKGYGYGENVDQYIKDYAQNPNMKIIENGGIERLNDMLFSGEINAFIDDSLVVLWLLKDKNVKVKLAGCLERKPFYLAVNPKLPWANKFTQLMNRILKEDANKKALHAIKLKYR